MNFPTVNSSRRQSGFSLVEILVTLLIFITITMGLLLVFDNSSRLARSQTQLAMLQQNQRVGHSELVRFAKMAGLGGLPLTRINVSTDQMTSSTRKYKEPGMFPRGFAVEVINSIEGGRLIDSLDASGGGSGDVVLEGSDVLIVRGVFTTPIYYVTTPAVTIRDSGCTPSNSGEVCLTDTGKKIEGTFLLPGKIRVTDDHYNDFPQNIYPLSERLKTAYTENTQETFILRDVLNPNAYIIVGLDLARITAATELERKRCTFTSLAAADPANPWCMDIPLLLDRNVALGQAYADLMTGTGLISGAGLTSKAANAGSLTQDIEVPQNVTSIGLLEEYRFYISDNAADGRNMLKRARFVTGTDTLIETIVVADNVMDLQIAVGADTDSASSGSSGFGQVSEDGTASDEVLFNAIGDYTGPPEAPTYADPPNGQQVWYNPDVQYHFLRINTLVQAEERDLRYQAPQLTSIEDYLRTGYNDSEERQFQRRWLQTIVELRNLQ